MGEGAKKKLAKRCINFWDGNISSYSRVLNSEEQLNGMREVNEVTAVLGGGGIRTENEQEKEVRVRASADNAEQRERRKAAAAEGAETRRASLLPELNTMAEAAISNVSALEQLGIGKLKDLL
jgi:hypothetical protein